MQNKIKTFAPINCSMREKRLLGFAWATERFDAKKVPATNEEISGILRQDADLKDQLETLKKLERGKRTEKSKDAISRLKQAIEEVKGIKIPDGRMVEIVHDLIEKHDKEVGTAIRVRSAESRIDENGVEVASNEDTFMLVHASRTATKLVLRHHNINPEKISAEKLKEIFEREGFKVDEEEKTENEDSYFVAKVYKKDKIPTARPFSEVVKNGWGVAVSTEEAKSAPVKIERTKIVAAPSVESLLKRNGTQKYEKSLAKVFGASEVTESSVNEVRITGWGQFLREFKKVGRKVDSIQKVARRGRDVTEKVKKSLRGKKADIKIGDVITFKKTPKKVATSAVHEFFRNPTEANRRKFSSVEFAKKVNISKLNTAQKTELIEAAIKLDVTVTNRRVKESGKSRLVFLEKQTLKNGEKEVQNLFKSEIGTGLESKDFYKTSPEKSTPNKDKIRDILSGDSEVFMLRIDAEKSNGKYDSRVERTRGAAWLNDLDAPQKLRSENGGKEYEYKYSEISSVNQKTEILKKYLDKTSVTSAEAANYQIAQVEIPNCENPAIVVKKLEKIVPLVAPMKKEVRISTTAVQYYKNVLGGWTLWLRPLDWFKPNSEFNHLADPAILDSQGRTIRGSEYLNARKRLDPEPHKFLAENIDDILGWHGSIGRGDNEDENSSGRSVRESLDNYLKKVSLEGQEKTNEKVIFEIKADLEKRLKSAGEGKTMESFAKRDVAKNEWRKEWTAKGADERMLKMVDSLYNSDFETFEALGERIRNEKEAYFLANFLKNNGDKLIGKKLSDFDNERLSAILKKHDASHSVDDLKTVIERVLYDEDKLNVARPPIFIGDAVFVPPTIDKKDRQKIVIWKNQTSVTKEMLNVHSPLSLALQVASFLTGYVSYIKTGIGHADALGEYLKMAKGSAEAREEFIKIFKSPAAFEAFRNFVLRGRVPETGGNKISIPLNEIQILIPGWKLLVNLFGEKCATTVGVKSKPPTPDPSPDVPIID